MNVSQWMSSHYWDFKLWFAVKKLKLSCRFWNFGGYGFPVCARHGFYSQSWITGECRRCEEIRDDACDRELEMWCVEHFDVCDKYEEECE